MRLVAFHFAVLRSTGPASGHRGPASEGLTPSPSAPPRRGRRRAGSRGPACPTAARPPQHLCGPACGASALQESWKPSGGWVGEGLRTAGDFVLMKGGRVTGTILPAAGADGKRQLSPQRHKWQNQFGDEHPGNAAVCSARPPRSVRPPSPPHHFPSLAGAPIFFWVKFLLRRRRGGGSNPPPGSGGGPPRPGLPVQLCLGPPRAACTGPMRCSAPVALGHWGLGPPVCEAFGRSSGGDLFVNSWPGSLACNVFFSLVTWLLNAADVLGAWRFSSFVLVFRS